MLPQVNIYEYAYVRHHVATYGSTYRMENTKIYKTLEQVSILCTF